MLFNSYIFLFLFLPLCLAGCYLLEKRGRGTAAKLWLTGFSLWFYGYFNLYYLAIMVCSILGNYCLNRLLLSMGAAGKGGSGAPSASGGTPGGNAARRAVMAAGVAANLGVLFYFKYFDFFLENINAVFGTSFALQHILLPLGISFFTFQQISFLVDTYRGEVQACVFVDYALFVSFFPQLIAGPIVNHAEMLPQFSRIGNRRWKAEEFIRGVVQFTLGMAKKVLLADTLGRAVDWGYGSLAGLNGTEALLVAVSYAFQLYFDFSGYCDMAKGLGGMLGIRIPENFDSPYRAVTVADFWKRWHITLTRFLTKYIYIPLGGNRKGKARMYGNILLVFFLSGLWHGAGWNFILWGLLHGLLLVLTRMAGERLRRIPDWINRTFTFLFVTTAWVLFRSETLAQAGQFFSRLLHGGMALPSEALMECFRLNELWYPMKLLHLDALPFGHGYPMLLILAAAAVLAFASRNVRQLSESFRPRLRNAAALAALFFWCVVSLSGVSTFLYFNF